MRKRNLKNKKFPAFIPKNDSEERPEEAAKKFFKEDNYMLVKFKLEETRHEAYFSKKIVASAMNILPQLAPTYLGQKRSPLGAINYFARIARQAKKSMSEGSREGFLVLGKNASLRGKNIFTPFPQNVIKTINKNAKEHSISYDSKAFNLAKAIIMERV